MRIVRVDERGFFDQVEAVLVESRLFVFFHQQRAERLLVRPEVAVQGMILQGPALVDQIAPGGNNVLSGAADELHGQIGPVFVARVVREQNKTTGHHVHLSGAHVSLSYDSHVCSERRPLGILCA